MEQKANDLFKELCGRITAQVREAWRLCGEMGMERGEMPGSEFKQRDSICFRDDGLNTICVRHYDSKDKFIPILFFAGDFWLAAIAADTILMEAQESYEKWEGNASGTLFMEGPDYLIRKHRE